MALHLLPTHVRVYRGLMESLGTYGHAEDAIRYSLDYDLRSSAAFMRYPGTSLLTKAGFQELYRKSGRLRHTSPDDIESAIANGVSSSQYGQYVVRLTDVITEGDAKQGYTLGVGLEQDILETERFQIYRSLGFLALDYFTPPKGFNLTFCRLPVPFPEPTIATFAAALPQTILLEQVTTAIFTEKCDERSYHS